MADDEVTLPPGSGEEGLKAAPWAQSTGSFIDLLYGVLAAPRKTFRHLSRASSDNWPSIGVAGGIVIAGAALDGLRFGPGFGGPAALVGNVVLSIYMGIMLWLSMVAVPAVLAKFFSFKRSKVQAFAVTSGWSFLPWVFMAPLSLWDPVLGSGSVFLFAVTLFCWIVYLLWIAAQESFSTTGKQTLCLLLILPQLIFLVTFLWLWQVVNETFSLLGVLR